ncbi:hypothetical protein [Dactylosporangium sp. NPDC050588]|uniref:hypothetical protein n=1 Tax=Dactylosporangium sp. NPDC050588 TaxID=3157211 RepID=UPI0033CA255C
MWDPTDEAERPARRLRWAVAAAVTTAVIAAATVTAAWMSVSPMLSSSTPECTEHDRRLTEQLAADPVLTSLRPA